MRSQPTESLAEVAVVPSALHQTHIGVVKTLLGAPTLAIDAKGRDGRADGYNQQEQDCGRKRSGQGWLASAPAPGLLETADGPRQDRFVAQEAAQFIGE